MPGSQPRATYDVLRLPDVRRIELGWGASVIGELAGQVTLVVYAFGAGGAVLVAAYVASRTLVGMVVTLGLAGVSGRLRPGGLVGGLAATRVVRVTRLGRTFIVALLLWGLPLVWLAATPGAVVAYLAFVIVGIGNAIEDVSGFTLIARFAGPRRGGRVLGATEFAFQAGLGAGSVAAPALLHALGVRGTLALLGGGLSVLALAHARRFARLDAAMPGPGPELELLRRLAMFAPLPLAVIELVASELVPREFGAGMVAIREGDTGDLFYLVVEGSAAVTVRGEPRPPLGPGDCFGEIALLHDIPRTATVVADQPLRTLALDRQAFLLAVTVNSVSRAAADSLAAQRLGVDSPGDAGGPAGPDGSDAGQDPG